MQDFPQLSPGNFEKEVAMKYLIATLIVLLMTDIGICLGADESVCNPGDINYYSSGKLRTCTLKDDLTINDVKCKQYALISLYETGMLKSCVIGDYYNYGNITCNQYSQVSLYPSGKLNTCDLSKTVLIEGKTCAEFGTISLFEDGKLKSCSTPP